ncbi:MAG TPA: hypothetical protein PKY35_02720 [Candidatus Hydrogenedentes bacterium]|nr:hypothetical protein [Candidatus Hydrogenedentota bacterium]HOL75915.1 hypothetical protein [Candidatus Hydrogenedentota bacterium]HPO85676.1 hypothetical protein [Candidatus Hydrogenedentota bacterium]
MKHITSITQRVPSRADAVQDIICRVLQFLADILGAYGGQAPLLGYLTGKCNIPEPNPE